MIRDLLFVQMSEGVTQGTIGLELSLNDNLSGMAADAYYLLQLCMSMFFRSKGSSYINPTMGGNAIKILRTPAAPKVDDAARVNIALSVRATDSQIKALQALDANIPDSARLKLMELRRDIPLIYDDKNDIWLIPIRILNYAGDMLSMLLPYGRSGFPDSPVAVAEVGV